MLDDFHAKWDAMKAGAKRQSYAPENQRPLPDVTMKGEELRKSRLARGCSVPVP